MAAKGRRRKNVIELMKWLDDNKPKSYDKLSEKLSCNPATIRSWVRGNKIPTCRSERVMTTLRGVL